MNRERNTSTESVPLDRKVSCPNHIELHTNTFTELKTKPKSETQ